MVKHRFILKNGNASEGEEDVDNDLDEDEQTEWDEMFIETEASKHIQEGNVAVIKTGDDHPYYLLKVTFFLKPKQKLQMTIAIPFHQHTRLWKVTILKSIRKPVMVHCIILIIHTRP